MRTLTEQQLREVIAYADSLQQYDRRQQDERLLERIVKQEVEKDGIPVSMAYEIGEEVGIPRQYLQRAVNQLYPNREQKKEDLDRVGAKPSDELVYDIYLKTLGMALSRQTMQEVVVGRLVLDNDLTYFKRSRERRRFWFRKKTRLARVLILPAMTDIDLYDPFFLQATGEELKKLQERFGRQHQFSYHYDPEE